ncbi:MAG: hypothetical protein WB763_00750 [Terriglobia bacterium]|jgi:hypothetical protein
MPNKRILKKSTVLFVLIIFSALAWGGDQKKTSAPPPSKPAPQAKAAPAPTRRTPPPPPNRGVTGGSGNAGRAGGVAGGNAGRGGGGLAGGGGNTGRGGPGPIPYRNRPGDQAKVLAGGRTEFRNANGQTVTTNARGEVQRIEVPRGLAGGSKMVINRGARGGRVVETGRPGARVVSYGPNRGFVERPLRPGYISRTYVRGGHSYAHVYREYRYHNMAYYRYVPGVYYSRRFYGWAVTPWGVPVHYAWFGMATPAPWFGFYSGYFTPYPVYASPDLWLTDYLLAENLRLAYENEQAAYAGQAPPPPSGAQPTAAALSPEVKAAIADEVRQQLKAESADAVAPASSQAQAARGEAPPAALDPKQSHFVVSSNLGVATADGQQCELTPGDVIFRIDDTPDNNNKVLVKVVSSKQDDCSVGAKPMLAVEDLQEMHNSFQEQLDSGLKTLAENQAKGVPKGPEAGTRQVPGGTAAPTPEAESQLAAQENDAAKLEAQVGQGGSAN